MGGSSMDFLVIFLQWFFAVTNVCGIIFSFAMFYWCLRGYIEVHFPSDKQDRFVWAAKFWSGTSPWRSMLWNTAFVWSGAALSWCCFFPVWIKRVFERDGQDSYFVHVGGASCISFLSLTALLKYALQWNMKKGMLTIWHIQKFLCVVVKVLSSLLHALAGFHSLLAVLLA